MPASRKTLLSALAVAAGIVTAADAKPPYDFHGWLFTCGRHPTVQVSGAIAYAYEADLTHYTQGTARLNGLSVTVSFPGKYGTFAITMRGGRFFSGGARCQADSV